MVLGNQFGVDKIFDQAVPLEGAEIQDRVSELFGNGSGHNVGRQLARSDELVNQAHPFFTGLFLRLLYFLGG